MGQAMTEFVIGAAFVLIPLFIFTSMAGKYADIKYAAVQSARYEAWEYTANYLDKDDQPSGFTHVANSDLPIKSVSRVQAESRRRFFSDTSTTLDSRFDRNGYISSDENPLWKYHDGSSMYNPLSIDTISSTKADGTTPDPTKIVTTTIKIFDTVFGAFGSLIGALGGDAKFDAMNEKGYATSLVSVPVEQVPDYGYLNNLSYNRTPFLSNTNLHFNAKAAVLTDSWSAGGTSHTFSQARGLVPTALLDVLLNPGGFPLQDIVATVLLSPELGRDSLSFGHMIDVIPPEKTDSGTHSCTDGGYCEY